MSYRVLLVDDEPPVLDWLKQLLSETFGQTVELESSLSAAEALRTLGAARFDIAVLDINMPTMSGLALLEEIRRHYPQMKVVFLTGMEEFDYARKAIDPAVVAYVLKDESDEGLLAAVREAMGRIDRETQERGLLELARKRVAEQAPGLRREFLSRQLEGMLTRGSLASYRAALSTTALSIDEPMLLLLSSTSDTLAGRGEPFERLFAARTALEDSMAGSFRFECAMPDEMVWAWLLQWRKPAGDFAARLRFLLDDAQVLYSRSTGDNLVIAHAESLTPLGEMSGVYLRLRPLLALAAGDGHVVLTERDLEDDREDGRPLVTREPAFRAAHVLQRLLDQGSHGELREVVDALLGPMESTSALDDPSALETYLTVSSALLSYVNKTGVAARVRLEVPLETLGRAGGIASWSEAGIYLRSVLEVLIRLQKTRRETRAERSVSAVKSYVEGHCGDDLSLVLLADRVGLNPSYLSSVFKVRTGLNLIEFIKRTRLRRASELLAERGLRINEIGRMVGYRNPAYFTRFFKSETGLTPQQWRDREPANPGEATP